jgi:cytochrome c-type biogenesis protein CcmH/NrfG
LGALLLEQGRFAEAEQVYRQDLKRRPKNPWSLYGLSDALRGQRKDAAAEQTLTLFQEAAKRCDVKIDRSCFCKNQDAKPAANE